MGEYHAMSVTPQNGGKFSFLCRPPAFPAADDDHRIGLKNAADGLGKIPAQVHLNIGFDGLFSGEREELLLGELYGDGGRFEFQRIGDDLRNMNRDARTEAAGQSAGRV